MLNNIRISHQFTVLVSRMLQRVRLSSNALLKLPPIVRLQKAPVGGIGLDEIVIFIIHNS